MKTRLLKRLRKEAVKSVKMVRIWDNYYMQIRKDSSITYYNNGDAIQSNDLDNINKEIAYRYMKERVYYLRWKKCQKLAKKIH